MTTTTLASLRNTALATTENTAATVVPGFDTEAGFVVLQRIAKLFASSSLVPRPYQGEANLGNAAIAVEMALRMRANPLLVLQNLFIVQGRPGWSSQFLIATLNQGGKYSSLRYVFSGEEGTDDWGCRAQATELATGEKLSGALITIDMAKKEGWYGKPGSKWQTMPEQMLRYRAASWFIRAYAPEIAMGLKTVEEVQDTIDLEAAPDGSFQAAAPQGSTMTLEDVKKATQKPARKHTRKMAAPAPTAPEPEPEPAQNMTEPPAAPAIAPVEEPDNFEETATDKLIAFCRHENVPFMPFMAIVREMYADSPSVNTKNDESVAAAILAEPSALWWAVDHYRDNTPQK